MGSYTKLKEAIAAVIRPNAAEEITGDVMQTALLNIVTSMGKYAQFGGIATPSTSPSLVDQNVFYIATQTGIYPNFSNVYVSGASVIYYDTLWRVHPLGLTESGSGGSGGDVEGDSTGERVTVNGPDKVIEGETAEFTARVTPGAKDVIWSITGGYGADSIHPSSGLLVLPVKGVDRNITVTATTIDTGVSGSKNLFVERVIYPEFATISGESPINQSATYSVHVGPSNINQPYDIEWELYGSAVDSGDVYIENISNDHLFCTVGIKSTTPATFELRATVTSASGSISVSKSVTKGETPGAAPDYTYIQIRQSESSPSTMIAGEINGTQIQLIRGGSNRYLGKFKNGKMYICQLIPGSTNTYYDGTPADLSGSEGDVFVKLPKFYYRALNSANDMWTLHFKINDDNIDSTWKTWDGNDLIGAYRAYYDGSKLRSISGQLPTTKLSQLQFKELARARGNGFSLVKWKHHCMMAMLFYAKYGTTNSQAVLGDGVEAYNIETGETNRLYMNDTVASKDKLFPVNFWGLESWWGGSFELLDNVKVNDGVVDGIWEITEDDGSVRNVVGSTQDGYISKFAIGENLDLVPIEVNGTNSTGFCDHYFNSSNTNRVCRRGGLANYEQAGIACVSIVSKEEEENGYNLTRLAFRGEIEELTVEEYKAIKDWA